MDRISPPPFVRIAGPGGQEHRRPQVADLERRPRAGAVDVGHRLVHLRRQLAAHLAAGHCYGHFNDPACRKLGQVVVIGQIDNSYGPILMKVQRRSKVDRVLPTSTGEGFAPVECAVGSPAHGLAGTSTFNQALRMVRNSGKMVQVAMYGEAFEVNLDSLREKSIDYILPHGPSEKLLQHTVDLVATKRVAVKPLITHRYPFSEAMKAYEVFEKKQENCIKVILKT